MRFVSLESASSGLDLFLEFEPGPARESRLESALRAGIRTGRIGPGTKLPATRVLARDLGVGRGTVVEAYSQLVAEGYLSSRVGSGTVVVWGPDPGGHAPVPAATPPSRPLLFDWRPGSPDLSNFPRRQWLRSMRRVISTLPSEDFDYGDPRGTESLRIALAEYLSRARGVRADPRCIVICSGYSQALHILGQSLVDRGAKQIAVEDPGLLWHRTILQSLGLATRAIPVDAGGLPVAELTSADAAVVITPAHQYPMGMALAPARRSAIVDWAQQTNGIVIEDDYDGEFRYDRDPIGVLQQLDVGRIVYVGTASKTLAPALRLAWMVVPPQLLDSVVAIKTLADRQTASIDQLVLRDLLQSGEFDRHVRRMRAHYCQRRNRLIEALELRVPTVRVEGIAAGLHVVIRLPDKGPSENEVVRTAQDRGLALIGVSAFSEQWSEQYHGLVIGYARPRSHTYGTGLDALVGLLADLVTTSPQRHSVRGPALVASASHSDAPTPPDVAGIDQASLEEHRQGDALVTGAAIERVLSSGLRVAIPRRGDDGGQAGAAAST
jgi:GntR family transcriptional regulator/MocR family aminotransferase